MRGTTWPCRVALGRASDSVTATGDEGRLKQRRDSPDQPTYVLGDLTIAHGVLDGMPPRPRPWQILLSCVEGEDRTTSRSFFTERGAVEAAIAWCGAQDSAQRPIANAHNRETSSGKHMVSDEVDPMRLASQSYRVQYNP